MHTRFVVATMVQDDEGVWTPQLPKGFGGKHVADGGLGSRFCICQIFAAVSEQVAPARNVTPELQMLLESATSYPPALASAAMHMSRSDWGDGEAAFLAEFATVLRERLSAQCERRHCLIAVRGCEPGFLDPGEYVWVVGYRPEDAGAEVAWVSRDYYFYASSITLFDVEPAWLLERFGTAVAKPA